MSGQKDGARVAAVLLYRDPRTLSDEEAQALLDAEARGEPRLDPLTAIDLRERGPAALQAHLEQLRALPRRQLPALLHEVPDWLQDAAAAGVMVRVFDGSCDRLQPATELLRDVSDRAERQARGHFTADEVAAALAQAGGLDLEGMRASVEAGFDRGKLDFWSSWSPQEPMDPAEEARNGGHHVLHYGAYTTPASVDRWLAEHEVHRGLRFPAGPWSVRPPREERDERPPAAPVLDPGSAHARGSPLAAPQPQRGVVRNAISKRRDGMAVLIEEVQSGLADPFDTAAVWVQLCSKAEQEEPPEPIIGRDDDALKVRLANSNEVGFFKRSDLHKRLRRQRERSHPTA